MNIQILFHISLSLHYAYFYARFLTIVHLTGTSFCWALSFQHYTFFISNKELGYLSLLLTSLEIYSQITLTININDVII